MIRLKHTQTTGYGCGMYSVANVLNLDSFVTDKRLEESKNGNRIYQLNKWLEEDGHSYIIECMYCTMFINKESGHGFRLPIETRLYSDDENLAICLLLNVKQFEAATKSHLIGAWVDSQQNLIIVDSLRTQVLITNWEELNNHYEVVYGIWVFQERAEDSKGYLAFDISMVK